MVRWVWLATLVGTGCVDFEVGHEPTRTGECDRPWIDADVPEEPRAMACDCDAGAVPFGGGSGTERDPYRVCTPEHLDAIRWAPTDHFELCADIDLEGVRFEPIPELSGGLRGNEQAICNWRVVDPMARDVAFVQELSGELGV